MIDAKDMARKAAGGCAHSITVLVPCADCTESRMREWETAVRQDTKQSLRDDIRNMEERMQKAESESKSLASTVERLKSAIVSLEQANETLRSRLKLALADASEARIQLHAEQTARTYANAPKLVRE